MITLSKRMQTLADLVSANDVFADIGCDHGFLSIYLVQSKKTKKAIAMDVRPGPLSRAREHVQQAGLQDVIELRLSDGLEKLSEGEAKSILISGMGGPLMEGILRRGEKVAQMADELILQPQSEIPEFRRFLTESGYVFLDENICVEDGKYYFFMKVVHKSKLSGAKGYIPAEDVEFSYGGLLLQRGEPLLYEYLLREKSLWEETKAHLMKQNQNEKIISRLQEISKKLELVNAAIYRMRR